MIDFKLTDLPLYSKLISELNFLPSLYNKVAGRVNSLPVLLQCEILSFPYKSGLLRK